MSKYEGLNPMQQEAVYHTEGPVLILAGAGSGKTRVLTHRIAYLIEEKGVNPWNIMAITFTNKAAQEMRERVDQIVGFGSESIWVSTFHSSCVRMLRRFIDRIGYENNFTIYDTDDQKTVIKEVCKRLNIDTKMFKERSLMAAISSAKDELISPEAFKRDAGQDWSLQTVARVYEAYQKQLAMNNALDFDDLIAKTVELLEASPEVLDALARALRLDEAERAHLFDLAHAASPVARPPRRRSTKTWSPHHSLQWTLDAITAGPAFVRNGRMDIVATNILARAFYCDTFDMPGHPPNIARFTFLDERAEDFYPDWDSFADVTVAILRTEAGRDPHNKELHDLIGELSTRSTEFRTRWGAHNVRHHGTGFKTFHHPVVGELTLAYEGLEMEAEPGLTLTIYAAEPGSPSAERIQLLASWAASEHAAGTIAPEQANAEH